MCRLTYFWPSGPTIASRPLRIKGPGGIKGKLRGKQPTLSTAQQNALVRMKESEQYTIVELAELFTVSRPTVYRVLERAQAHHNPGARDRERNKLGLRSRQQPLRRQFPARRSTGRLRGRPRDDTTTATGGGLVVCASVRQ